MRKRKILLFVTEMALLAGFIYITSEIEAKGAPVTSDSLLLDGGFEILTRARGSWTEDPQGGWEIDMTNSYRGNNFLKATVAWSWLSQEMSVKPEKYYALKAYVKSDMTIPEKEDYHNTFLTLECLDEGKRLIQSDWGIVNATLSWQLKENLILAPPDTREIRIKLAKRQGKGSVWFDEVELREVRLGSVLNSGFEVLSNKKPKFWKQDPKGGWLVATDEFHEGERSIRTAVVESWLSQETPVKDNRCYLLSAYVRSDITISRNTCLTLESLDKDDRVLERRWGVVNATLSWQLKENLIFAPPGTQKIRIRLAKRQGEGSVWFDEAKLVKMPLSLVLNSGFEILDSLGRPRLWGVDSLGGWSANSEAPHEGQRSMRATVAWSWLSQEILVKPKTYYTLVVYLRSDIAIPKNTFLTLECLDKDNKVFKRKWGIVNATFSWQVKKNLIFASPDTKKIRIRLAKRQGEGFVWFDGVKLVGHEFPWEMLSEQPNY